MTRIVLAALAAAMLATAPPAAAQSLLDQARDAVREAQQSIDDAARAAGRSAGDFLADNPGLNRDIIDLGQRLGVPGFADVKPYAGASLDAAPPAAGPGAAVTLIAAGLPGAAPVVFGFGPPGETFSQLGGGTTTARGSFEITIKMPAEAVPGSVGAFTMETRDGRVRLVSAPFTIANPGPPAGTRVSVTGTVSSEGVECPTVRGDDGKLYSLTDPTAGGFRPGDRVHVAGEVAGMSMCLQGIPLTGSTITAANG